MAEPTTNPSPALAATPPAAPAAAPAAPTAAPTPVTPPPGPQAHFIVKLAIIGFVTLYIGAAMWLLLDVWVLDAKNLHAVLGLEMSVKLPPVFISALHAMLGAVLGAGVMDIVSFHNYNSVKGDFQSRHVWGYFVAPMLAAVLGLITFALLQSGLLVFAGGPKGNPDDLARLGYLAVGFLAGFGWYEAVESIRGIVKRFFGAKPATPAPAPPPSAAAPAAPPAPPTA